MGYHVHQKQITVTVLINGRPKNRKARGYNIWNTKTERYILKNFVTRDILEQTYKKVVLEAYERKIMKVLDNSIYRADKYGCEIPAPEGRCTCI